MTMPDDTRPSPEHASDLFYMNPLHKNTAVHAGQPCDARSAPRDSALRRKRLQIMRQLKHIRCLQEQVQELRAEISSLESIIGAQADAIDALRRQK